MQGMTLNPDPIVLAHIAACENNEKLLTAMNTIHPPRLILVTRMTVLKDRTGDSKQRFPSHQSIFTAFPLDEERAITLVYT